MNHLFPYLERQLLHPNVTIAEQYAVMDDLTQLGWAGAVIAPFWTKKWRRELGDTHPATLTTAIGWPYGYQRTEVKQLELELAVQDGANAMAVVLNTSALFSPTSVWLKIELAKLVAAAHSHEKPLTVVLEPAFLDTHQLAKMIKTATDAGADALRIGTGAAGPVSLADALAFRAGVPRSVGCHVWAEGLTMLEMEQLISAGVERLVIATAPA